jgi:hypothetical protein
VPLLPLELGARTNFSSARFGFGGSFWSTACFAWMTPTPPEVLFFGSPLAVTISAPLTWSGVNVGCRARMFAAAPATTGAANDVPESCMYPGEVTLPGRSETSVASCGTGPIMYRPGAETSGFAKPSMVEPHADHGAIVALFGSADLLTSAAPTVMTNGSSPGLWMTPLGPVSKP